MKAKLLHRNFISSCCLAASAVKAQIADSGDFRNDDATDSSK